MMKSLSFRRIGIILAISFAVMLAVFSVGAHLESRRCNRLVELTGFRSDFSESVAPGHRRLFADYLGREKLFLAYSRYADLPAGRFSVEFSLEGMGSGSFQVEISAQRGRKVLAKKKVKTAGVVRMDFTLDNAIEVEPRVRLLSGDPGGRVKRVIIKPEKLFFPWNRVLAYTLLFGMILALFLLAFDASLPGSPHWRHWLAGFLLAAGFVLVVSRAWVSEDAFITLRHVDNLLDGYGPVFNPGERVEGFTHVLWMAIVTVFRATGINAKGAVMIPALICTVLTLYLILFRYPGAARLGPDNRWWINPALPLLLGTSGFIDFSTSGLETPLSFTLLAIYALLLRREKPDARGIGWVLALMVLTRPDFVVFSGVVSIYFLFSQNRRRERVRNLFRLWTPSILMLGLIQVWRMGYYAALLPNPFYAKSGAGSHWFQGLAYLWDLIVGSPASIVFLLAAIGTIAAWRKHTADRDGRMLIAASALVHGFFVIRGGGDFMHARFLLPAMFLLALTADIPVTRGGSHKLAGRVKVAPVMVVVLPLLMLLALGISPLQTRGDSLYHHGISDERFSYYGNRRMPLADLFEHRLLFIWRTMGQNYAHLAAETGGRFTVAYANIGFLGYYAGTGIRVIDRLGLTDPVTSRVRLKKRRRPGHEKSSPLAYLVRRGVTFATTPFPRWNRLANTPYGPLWDLSPRTRRRLRTVLPLDFKRNIDQAITAWLRNPGPESPSDQGEWLFFLSRQWVPHAPAEARREFQSRFPEKFLLRVSRSARWLRDNGARMDALLERIHGPLSKNRFLDNLSWCIRHPLGVSFSYPGE